MWISSFGKNDALGVDFPHQDPLLITANITGCDVRRVLVDGGSFVNLLFVSAFDQMAIPRNRLDPPGLQLLGFGGETVKALGQITLEVAFGVGERVRTKVITFDMVDLPYPYNATLGRATLNTFGAVPHHNYLCMKLPGAAWVITVHGDQDLARQIKVSSRDPRRKVHKLTIGPT